MESEKFNQPEKEQEGPRSFFEKLAKNNKLIKAIALFGVGVGAFIGSEVAALAQGAETTQQKFMRERSQKALNARDQAIKDLNMKDVVIKQNPDGSTSFSFTTKENVKMEFIDPGEQKGERTVGGPTEVAGPQELSGPKEVSGPR